MNEDLSSSLRGTKQSKIMKKLFYILTFFSLFSCKKNTEVQNTENNFLNTENENYTIIERYFPEKQYVEKFDTLIQNIQVSITTNILDTYVINEHETPENKTLYIDKYRDNQMRLKISQNSETIIDTVFVKESFLNYVEQSFLDISNLYNYSLYKIEGDTIVFFGSIIKPETSIAFVFKHKLNLKNFNFFIEEIEE